MKILLLGTKGQLGWELARCLPPLGEMVAVAYPEINLALPDSIRGLVRRVAPELIINATAYTAVDQAESELALAYAINGAAPGVLAEEARRLGAAFIHYSTDYVFDGAKGVPYCESDGAAPINVYGASKLQGEEAVQAVGGAYLILRTAWVYSMRGDNFVRKVLRWARQSEILQIVQDQFSNPTWARMLAEATTLLLARGTDAVRDHTGIFHLAGGGYASRLEWALEILKLDPNSGEQSLKQVVPAQTRDFPAPAQRPLFSALDCSLFERTFSISLPPWKTALQLALS